MATPLERIDQIRDDLTSRGIIGSRLGQQSIQRQNLPTLGESLGTSRAVRAAEERKNAVNLDTIRAAQKQATARVPKLRSGAGVGAGKTGSPRFTLRASSAARNILFSENPNSQVHHGFFGSPGKGLEITEIGTQGNPITRSFTSTTELMDFLSANPEIQKNLGAVAGDPIVRAGSLKRAGGGDALKRLLAKLPSVSVDSLRQGRGSGGGGLGIFGSGGAPKELTDQQKVEQKLGQNVSSSRLALAQKIAEVNQITNKEEREATQRSFRANSFFGALNFEKASRLAAGKSLSDFKRRNNQIQVGRIRR